jgi:hypothetical protein
MHKGGFDYWTTRHFWSLVVWRTTSQFVGIWKLRAYLTPKSLNLVKVIFATKRVSTLFFFIGSKKRSRININAPLDLKNIIWITSYQNFKTFSKHMSRIRHFECTNIKWGSSCLKLWQTFEGSKKKLN